MQDIEFNCSHCGYRFAVLGVLAGAEAICPGCAKTCKVPMASQAAEGGRPAPARSKPKGAPATPPAPVASAKPAGSFAKPVLAAVVGAALVGLTGYWFKTTLTAEPDAEPAPQVALTDPAPASLPQTEPLIPAPPEEPETGERAMMRHIAALMLKKYPLAQAGDPVALTLRNGITYEGTVVSMDERFVTIERDEAPVQLAFNTLDLRSRTRVDNEFRIDVLKKLVRAAMARPPVQP